MKKFKVREQEGFGKYRTLKDLAKVLPQFNKAWWCNAKHEDEVSGSIFLGTEDAFGRTSNVLDWDDSYLNFEIGKDYVDDDKYAKFTLTEKMRDSIQIAFNYFTIPEATLLLKFTQWCVLIQSYDKKNRKKADEIAKYYLQAFGIVEKDEDGWAFYDGRKMRNKTLKKLVNILYL